MAIPRTKTAVRALLGAHGLHPRKLCGQHFLVDGNLVDAIARDAGVGPRDTVLEVGTGTGILTDVLADRAGQVVTCDVDGRLQQLARGLRSWPVTVRFMEADILAGKHRLNPDVIGAWQEGQRDGQQERQREGQREGQQEDGRLRLIANLPYSVATPLLANLLWSNIPVEDAVVLVQREAAERFTAAPGTKEYGPMAVAVALLADARILRPVGPQVFWPPPKVQSALLRLEFRRPDTAPQWIDAGLPRLLQEAFQHRRKTLRKALGEERVVAAGLDPSARPEEVAPEVWPSLLTTRPL